jgi:hypothetical protein
MTKATLMDEIKGSADLSLFDETVALFKRQVFQPVDDHRYVFRR